MRINLKFLGLAGAMSAVVSVGQMAACTTDSTPADAGVGGSGPTPDGGTSTGGSSAGGAGAGGSTAVATRSVCVTPILIPSTKPGITDFENYDGHSDLATWSFNLGGDSSLGVYAGTFGYGDIKGTDSTGKARTDLPKTFDMVTPGANNSTYALRIADTMAMNYGGGQGLWISACLNATQFAGISFWVRGSTPKGNSTLTLSMGDTTSSTPSSSGSYGTCSGTSTTCKHPTFVFPVTDTWTQIKVSWASFTAGDAAGTPVHPDGRNITQLQLGIDLNWVPGPDGGAYVPVPAPYEVVSDNWAFY
jgi:hypothetical protein